MTPDEQRAVVTALCELADAVDIAGGRCTCGGPDVVSDALGKARIAIRRANLARLPIHPY